MKGLIVTPAYYPDKTKGGSIAGCRSFAKAISINHEVEICTLDTTNQGERSVKVDGIRVLYFKVTKGLEWLSKSGWGFSIKFSYWFIKNFKNYDYIYIRSLWNYISLFSSIVCIISGKKYGISSSGKFSKYALKSSFLKKALVFPLILFIIRKSTFIHYPTKSEYESAPRYLTKLTSAIILNTAIEFKKSSSKENRKIKPLKKFLIYTVSRFDEIKRIELLAKVSNKIVSKADFVHIGNYQENITYFRSIKNIYQDSEFEIKFKTNNLNCLNNDEKSVFFLGYLNINEVDKLIKNYQESIFIQMSYSEGQSNSILEAMARGSICIVSEGCNMQNAKNLNSIIITKDSELPKEINKLLKNNMLIEKLRDNQYRYLREFHSLKKISKQFDIDIKSLL